MRFPLVVWASLLFCVAVAPSQTEAQVRGGVASTDELPADFRGTITYRGTHEGELQSGPRRGSRQYGGVLNLEVTFDGNEVAGHFSGTGGINRGSFSGTRTGTRCRLFEERAGDIIEGECSRTRFSARAQSQNSRNAMAAIFEASAVGEIRSAATASGPLAAGAPRLPAAAPGGSTILTQCGSFGFPAPRSQAEIEQMRTTDLLVRGQAMHRNWGCSALYFSVAALRNDIQGMAAYSYNFSADSPKPDQNVQTYWCQKAYQATRAERRAFEIDAVNHFCPVETIAALMTPAERQANRVSEVRALQTSQRIQQEAENNARRAWNSATDLFAGPSRPAGQCIIGNEPNTAPIYGRCP